MRATGKRTRTIRTAFLLGAALVLLTSASLSGGTPVTVTAVPSIALAPPGSSFTVDVVISGLGNLAAPSVGAFDLLLAYDPAIFAFTGATAGVLLGDPNAGIPEANVTITPGATNVNVLEVSLLTPAALLALQPSSFTLFTVSFNAIGLGTGTFTPVPNGVGPLGDENGALLAAAYIPGDVQGGSLLDIPTLGGWGLMLLAGGLLIAGIVLMRRIG